MQAVGAGRRPRSARGAATRARIVAAASSLYSERGDRAVSLRDVAAAADLSQPGLLRHFPSKDQLLEAVLTHHLQAADAGAVGEGGFESWVDDPAATARDSLLVAIAGEATSVGHPLHELMRDRYAADVADLRDRLIASAQVGGFGAGRDPGAAARELIAARDGLRIMRAYLGEDVDIPAALRTRRETMRGAYGAHGAGFPPRHPRRSPVSFDFAPPRDTGPQVRAGYAVGRVRRQQILDRAIVLFSQAGYAATSLRELAESVGITKSALLHHFASKEELLRAVLLERDHRNVVDVARTSHMKARDGLLAIAEGARQNSAHARGLVELYTVLACEAIPDRHAAHDYFADRYARAVATLESAFRGAVEDGDLPSDRDPHHEALWVVALWDGLQIQWLYHSSVDVGADLETYVRDVLPERRDR